MATTRRCPRGCCRLRGETPLRRCACRADPARSEFDVPIPPKAFLTLVFTLHPHGRRAALHLTPLPWCEEGRLGLGGGPAVQGCGESPLVTHPWWSSQKEASKQGLSVCFLPPCMRASWSPLSVCRQLCG